ncbi:MAG: cell division protein FtsQ/DivIB, partial [Candidatus Sumerlaeia bacterium]|nr:cell division protein FtsQ/DivIB [Candidatus Sumerlaeia bacterium]
MAFYWKHKDLKPNKIFHRQDEGIDKKTRYYVWIRRIKYIVLTFLRLLIALILIGFFAFIVRAFYFYLLESEYFRIKEVNIDGVKKQTSEEIAGIIDAKGLMEKNIFRVSVSELKERLTTNLPKLTGIEVKKIYPATIFITARERKPIAYISARKLYLMDKEGVIIEQVRQAHQEMLDLVLITGVDQKDIKLGAQLNDSLIATALEIIFVLQKTNYALLQNLSEIHITRPNTLSLILSNGTELRLSRQDVRKQLAILEAFLNRIKD